MKIEIKVPPAGESVSEAAISQILKENGSVVNAEEELLELETDKVNQIVYAPAQGCVQWRVKIGDVVKVGQVLGEIDTDVKEKVAQVASFLPLPEEKKMEPQLPSLSGPPSRMSVEQHLQSLREENSKKEVSPTITSKTEFTSSKLDQEKGVSRKKMSSLRKTIAERLVAAKNQTAMLTTFNEVDMSQILEIRLREQENFLKRYGVKLGFMSFFVKATIAALKEYPEVHSVIEGDDILTYSDYSISIAVSTEKGLMVPVIRNCEQKTFGEIEKEIGLFAKKAREGTLSIEEMRGGTFTITNGGVFGSMLSTPILNLPQSAILGMHTITKRPVVVKDQVVIRPMMYLALSYDHRLIDGREAIQFLVHIKNSLEEPTRMLIDL